MLQQALNPSSEAKRFDLAPTGALCYRHAYHCIHNCDVLISLPQERCATFERKRNQLIASF